MKIRTYSHPEPGAVDGGAAPKPVDNQPATEAPKKPDPPPIVQAVPEKKPEPEKPLPSQAPVVRSVEDVAVDLDNKAKLYEQKAQAYDAKLEKARQKAVIAELRKMGADPDIISDADLLLLAPKVDPDDDGAGAELLKFKQSRPGYFARAHAGPQESLATVTKRVDEDTRLTPEQKERKRRMAQRLMGGDQ